MMGQPYLGEIRIFAGNFAPQGWAFCSGQLMAIAEHEPSKVYKRNRGVTKMSKSQLHDYASTKGL